MANNPESRPHIISTSQGIRAPRKKRGRGPDRNIAEKPNPIAHASSLLSAFDDAREDLESLLSAENVGSLIDGIVVELRLRVGAIEYFDSLGLESFECQVLQANEIGDQLKVLVFVPQNSVSAFRARFTKYMGDDRTKKGKRFHGPLIDSLDSIELAAVRSYWNADPALIPSDGAEHWWEIWLLPDGAQRFAVACAEYGLSLADSPPLTFAERIVLFVNGTLNSLYRAILASSAVAEIRPKYGLAGLIEGFEGKDHTGAAEEMATRREWSSGDPTYVTILDVGVHAGHPMLAGVLDVADVHTVVGGGGTTSAVHGDGMAGLAVFGSSLDALVASPARVPIHAKLESVRVFGGNAGEAYGATTRNAVALVATSQPDRRRLHCLALTEMIGGPFPSSWSAAIDYICAGDPSAANKVPELVFVAAGNVDEPIHPTGYAGRNEQESCQSPAQAWNAITVGGMTRLVDLAPAGSVGATSLAKSGDLSPTSTTSISWDSERSSWPLKPDIVMEGGNCAVVPSVAEAIRYGEKGELVPLSLQLHPVKGKFFQEFGDTSGATALAANLGARVWNENPNLWPESVRGLIVHSASHTAAMRARIGPGGPKSGMRKVFRMFGYGAPDIDCAIESATNRAVVIHQASIQPFRLDNKEGRINELKFFNLPIPASLLAREFSEVRFRLRVTLSYYIEPNPGGRTYRGKYSYASHRLAFSIQRPGEAEPAFRARVQDEAATSDDLAAAVADIDINSNEGWIIGSQVRNASTVQSDWLEEEGAKLAKRSKLAVYPMGGWWKNRPKLGRVKSNARFSLIVSLETEQSIDIYTPVKTVVENLTIVAV